MSSLILRTLNAYPEWKTMKTTTEVAKFIVSKNNENPEYPTNINTTRQKKRYFEKFGTDFIVEKGKKGTTGSRYKKATKGTSDKIYYRPIIENTTDDYRINLLIVPKNTPSKQRENYLKVLFDDISKGSAIGIKAFYSQVTQHYLGFSRDETTEFLKKQGVYNVSRPYKKVINRPVIAKTPNGRWGIDAIAMNRYHFKPNQKQSAFDENSRGLDIHNEGGEYTHILTCVDYFSKKVWAKAMTADTVDETLRVFKEICKDAGTKPRILQTDNGAPYISKEFADFLWDEPQTQHILTKPYASTSNGLIERVNAMVRAKIRDGFVRNDNLEWVKYLPQYVDNINNQKPARSKFTPNQLWKPGYTPTPRDELIKTDMKITDKSSKEDIIQAEKYNILKKMDDQVKYDANKRKYNTETSNNLKVGDNVRIKLTAIPLKIAKLMIQRHKNNAMGAVKYSAITYTPDIYEIVKVIERKPRKKKGETSNDAEVRFKLLNTGKTTYTLKNKITGIIVKDYESLNDRILYYLDNYNADDRKVIQFVAKQYNITETVVNKEFIKTKQKWVETREKAKKSKNRPKSRKGLPTQLPNTLPPDEIKKKPMYFFKSDLQFIPPNSISMKLDNKANNIDRTERLNRLKAYTDLDDIEKDPRRFELYKQVDAETKRKNTDGIPFVDDV